MSKVFDAEDIAKILYVTVFGLASKIVPDFASSTTRDAIVRDAIKQAEREYLQRQGWKEMELITELDGQPYDWRIKLIEPDPSDPDVITPKFG